MELKTENQVDKPTQSKGFKRLQEKWDVTPYRMVIIFVVFGLTGTTVVWLKGYFYAFTGLDKSNHQTFKTIMYLLFMFPAYQVLLLSYAFCLGEFTFFWNKFKKIGSLFKSRKK
jgi:hypothetical protein